MSKRQAEFQIHNQPMTEAEIRAANMMNNSTPQKATPAQLAARKIREAKSSQRRRTPGVSPGPSGPSSAMAPQATNFFTGANGVNGVQQQPPPPPPPQPFAAPSSNGFNFTAPTGHNPFTLSTPSVPFSTQALSNPFNQQTNPSTPSGATFGQPAAASQQSTTTFAAPSNFSFGQSTGMNSSFPQTQNNTSIFSKSTPAPSSFTFGSNLSFPPQTPTFGAPVTDSTQENGESMEMSGGSPSKTQGKSSASEQTAEANPAAPSVGSTSAFAFKPANNDLPQGQKAQTPQPFGSFFPFGQPGIGQPTTQASSLFQPSKTTYNETSQEQSLQPSAPIFNFFPTAKEPGSKTVENPAASSATPASSSFAALNSAEKPAEKRTTEEAKAGGSFVFGSSSEAPQTESKERISQQKTNEAKPFHSFQTFPSNDSSTSPQRPQERKAPGEPIQHSQSNGLTPFSSLLASMEATANKTPTSTLFGSFQPAKSVGAKSPQDPAQPDLQSFKSTNTNTEEPRQPSVPTTKVFEKLKPSSNGASRGTKSPPKLSPNNISQEPKDIGAPPGEVASTYPKRTSPPSSGLSQPTKPLKSALKSTNTQSATTFGNATKQSPSSAVGSATKTPSQTSSLFVKSLGQASTALNSAIDPLQSQSPLQPRSHSPTEPMTVSQKTADNLSTTVASSNTISDPLKVKVKSYGSSNVPQELDDGSFVDYDKSCRLHTLNAQLQKHIADLDPIKHDFEPVIRFYATQRAAIGYPMGGLYQRAKAGDKRKTDQMDRDEDASNIAKRPRIDPSVASSAATVRPVFSFSAITSVSTSPQLAIATPPAMETNVSSKPFANGSTVAQPAAPTSTTSNVFKSMLSSSNQSTFGTHIRPGGFSPIKSASAASIAQPPGQGPPPSAPSKSTSIDNKTSDFQYGTESNNNISRSSTSSGAHNPSPLFQPKPVAGSVLEPPKFASAGGTDFMIAFAAQAKKNAAKMEAESKAKRKAEEFDSDEDDEAEYERRVAEEDRAKRARIEALAKAGSGFTPVLSSASSANGASPAADQDGESNRDASGEGSDDSGTRPESEFTDEEDENEDAERDEDYEEDSPEHGESDEDDDIQTAMAKSHAKAKDPVDSSSDPKSLFSRITRPGPPSEGTESKVDTVVNNSVPSAPLGTGLFGSRPTTPNLDSPKPFGTSIFSNVGSSTPTGDNTWKPGSAIKFGSPTSAPTVNILPATPLAKTNGDSTHSPFSTFSAAASTTSKPPTSNDDSTPKASSVFGTSAFAANSSPSGANTPKTFGSLFGDSKKTTANQSSAAQVGFSFGGPSKPGASVFLAPSDISSAITSRATSPGLTDNESAAESSTDDHANEPQPDYMASRPGEEDEDVLFEVRTKVLEYKSDSDLSAVGSKDESGWKTRGLGPLRILRNSETGRTRMVMRSEPGANVIINAPLIQDNKYDVNPSGSQGASLKMGIFMHGKLKNWVFKLKTIKIANELVDHLKQNESTGVEQEKA